MSPQDQQSMFNQQRDAHSRRIMGDAMAQAISLQATCDVLGATLEDREAKITELQGQLAKALAELPEAKVTEIMGEAPPSGAAKPQPAP